MQARPNGWRIPSASALYAVLLAASLFRAPTLAAQEEAEEDYRPNWRTSYFPYFSGLANDGPVVSARLRYWQPAAYEARTTYAAALDAGAGISFRGTRYAKVRFRAPGLWKDWRLDGTLMAERLVRFGYFGLGNDTEHIDELVTDETPFTYRVRRIRYEARAEVTRRLRGPFYAALRTDLQQARFTTLPGPSLFIDDFGEGLEQDDFSARLAFIYDTRDNEFNTLRGMVAEAGGQVGSGGDGYTRLYAVVRGYLPLREGTTVAARVVASGMGGTPTLNARFHIPTWNDDIPVLGGEYLPPLVRHRTLRRQGHALRQLGGPAGRAALRRSRRADRAGVRGRGAGVRGGVVRDHGRRPARRGRRRDRAADSAVDDLHVQLRGRAGRVQLLGGERVDVLSTVSSRTK